MRIDTARLSPAERLLWSHGVVEPDQIDLEAIANARGARVVHRHLDGCEARLVASAEQAVISVNIAGGYEGRRRFSLAHELAHWICDRKTGSFQCAKEVIGPQNAEAKSVEAPPRANMTCATYPREISEQRGRYDEQPTTQGPDASRKGFFRSGCIARSP